MVPSLISFYRASFGTRIPLTMSSVSSKANRRYVYCQLLYFGKALPAVLRDYPCQQGVIFISHRHFQSYHQTNISQRLLKLLRRKHLPRPLKHPIICIVLNFWNFFKKEAILVDNDFSS